MNQDATTHDDLVTNMTGGMVTTAPRPFTGSDLLRPDGRPRAHFRRELRKIDNKRNALLVAAVLLAPVAVVAIVGSLDRWWAVALAIVPMGIVQNHMYILHHEAAHRLLFSSRRVNDVIGINLLGWLPFGTGTHHYRRGHANHHRDEFGPNEPDFLLYALYPIAPASARRKLRRDLTGVSAYRIVKPRFVGLAIDEYRTLSLRFFAGQVFVAALFVLGGSPWLYLWLWLLPYITWYQGQNRLRAVSEHGGMTRSDDRRDTTHHIEQSPLARALLVPHGVGYHLAHHVDSGVPFRNLSKLHRALNDAGYFEGASMWPSYTSLWRSLIRT